MSMFIIIIKMSWQISRFFFLNFSQEIEFGTSKTCEHLFNDRLIMFDNIARGKKGSFAHKLKENHLKKEVFLRNIIENCLHEKTKSEERMILIEKSKK